MGWVGSTFTLLHDFSVFRDSNPGAEYIDADDVDEQFTDLKSGLEALLLRNGSNSPTGNIDWAGKIITNLGAPLAAAHAARFQDAWNKLGAPAGGISEYTISSGAIAPANNKAYIRIDTQSDAASDELNIISSTYFDQDDLLLVRAENSSRTIILRHGTGADSLVHADGRDLALEGLDKYVLYRFGGTKWHEVIRSTNLMESVPNAGFGDNSFTISSGAVVPRGFAINIDTEGLISADDLDSITSTNYRTGDCILLRASLSDRSVRIKHGTGNLVLAGSADLVLADSMSCLLLRFDGTDWIEVFRSSQDSQLKYGVFYDPTNQVINGNDVCELDLTLYNNGPFTLSAAGDYVTLDEDGLFLFIARGELQNNAEGSTVIYNFSFHDGSSWSEDSAVSTRSGATLMGSAGTGKGDLTLIGVRQCAAGDSVRVQAVVTVYDSHDLHDLHLIIIKLGGY